jgi:hypothetical protein
VAVAANGFMYIMGGGDGTSTLQDVQVAPINANGTLGSWTGTTSMPAGRGGMGATAYNGYVYVISGYDPSGVIYQSSSYAPLNAIARYGRYSKIIDMGGNRNVISLTYSGNVPAGKDAISYRAAGPDGIFDTTGSLSDIQAFGFCTSSLQSIRYILITVELDDSSAGTFGDSAGATANLTDITMNYQRGHPASNIRLHLGKTLVEGEGQTPLDTCGNS